MEEDFSITYPVRITYEENNSISILKNTYEDNSNNSMNTTAGMFSCSWGNCNRVYTTPG
jgi:hypothetical protein